MAPTRNLANFYAFRQTVPVYEHLIQPQSPEDATLAGIDLTITNAHKSYLARRYQVAIELYHEAESEIYALLNPLHVPGTGGGEFPFPRDAHLFDSLLSASV